MKRHRTFGAPAVTYLAAIMLTAALTVTPIALLTSHDLGAIGGWDWFWLAVMVLVPGTLGHGLMTWSQRYADATISTMLSSGEPVLSALGAWVIYDEAMTGQQILGAAVVLVALGLLLASQRVVIRWAPARTTG
jgi:drug/metabolite transporter (DMT)-like permease